MASDSAVAVFTEKIGLILEKEGYSRVAGRLFGLLLVTEEPISLDEVALALSVSKASISVNAHFLEHRGVLERVTLPGDRHDYLKIAPNLLAKTMEQRLARWSRFRDVIGSCKDLLDLDNQVIQDRLDYIGHAYEYVLGATARALEEWEQGAGGQYRSKHSNG